MAAFDVIGSAAKAYRFTWAERHYLARLAIVPVMVKLVCFVVIMSFGWEREFIRQAIIMLPSYFTEGWLLSHTVRLIYFGQRWPFRPTGDKASDNSVFRDRARGISAGTIFYVLLRFIQNGIFALAQSKSYVEGDTVAAAAPEPTLILFVLSLALLAAAVWTFRFFWLFIPAAANYPIRNFIRRINGFSTSINLIATWMICFFPLIIILLATIPGSARLPWFLDTRAGRKTSLCVCSQQGNNHSRRLPLL